MMRREAPNRMKRGLTNVALVAVSLAIAFAGAEIASRVFLPISPGVRYYEVNNPSNVKAISASPLRHVASMKVRQVSTEFNAGITFTSQGHRVPAARGNPDIIFLGDSFTFGQGLEDEETFPYIYCAETELSCANLARSGTGTGVQVAILEHYLKTEGWRPRQVKLFMMAMTGALTSGNDIFDNILEEARAIAPEETIPSADKTRSEDSLKVSWALWISQVMRRVRYESNLIRVAYFQAAPVIRTWFSPKPSDTNLAKGLAATRRQLEYLERMCRHYGFTYSVYVIHPMQDILRGTHNDTVRAIQNLVPDILVKGTAPLFIDKTTDYYYPYDGHFNALGSRKIADYLLSQRQP